MSTARRLLALALAALLAAPGPHAVQAFAQTNLGVSGPVELPVVAPLPTEAGLPASDERPVDPAAPLGQALESLGTSSLVPAVQPAARPIEKGRPAVPLTGLKRIAARIHAAPQAAALHSAPYFDGSTQKPDAVETPSNDDLYPEPDSWDQALEPEAGAPKGLEDAPIEVPPDRAYAPSPEDWRDELFYSVFVDRFAKGAGARPHGKPESGHTWHGGNLRGIIDKLDYIEGTGATTLLLSSVIMSAPGGYHGYWPVHQMAIDPHYGTMADFKELVAKAHAKGMKVVFDLVLNHVGKVFEYVDGDPNWKDGEPREVRWLRTLSPRQLEKDEHFYRRGAITDWNDADQSIKGDFPPDLRHFNVERPETQDILIHVAKWWMKETDVDGFRLDAYKHMHPRFWDRFFGEVRAYAAQLGKKNFLVLGEISTGSDSEVAAHLDTGKLDAAFNYPGYRRDNAALHGRAPTQELEHSFWGTLGAIGKASGRLLRFIDNHDVYRFLRSSTPEPLLRVAFAYLLFSLGIPMLYYGTEQAFRQSIETMAAEGPKLPADPRNREDMFGEGRYKSQSSAGDKFDASSAGYRAFAQLAKLRKLLPALRRGQQYVRWSDRDRPGLFAFSRIHDGVEVLVLLNTSGESRAAEMFVDAGIHAPGTTFEDRLEMRYRTTSFRSPDGGVKVSVDLPPFGVRVLTRR